MLLERAAKWPQQWLEEGEKKGRKEGKEEGLKLGVKQGKEEGMQLGLREGEARLLKSLASHRFGELPDWAAERFDRADVDTLDHWSRRLLDAGRLEDVFDD